MAVVLALITRFAGAFLAFAAAVVVNRHLATREHRTTLFLEILPEVLPGLEAGQGTSAEVQEIVERVQRYAIAASPTDRNRVLRTDPDVRAALNEQGKLARRVRWWSAKRICKPTI